MTRKLSNAQQLFHHTGNALTTAYANSSFDLELESALCFHTCCMAFMLNECRILICGYKMTLLLDFVSHNCDNCVRSDSRSSWCTHATGLSATSQHSGRPWLPRARCCQLLHHWAYCTSSGSV